MRYREIMNRLLKKIARSFVVFILTIEARLVLLKYKPTIIAVTGSVGKTTTKEMIAWILSEKFFVRASPKSFNSDIGVPLGIVGATQTGWQSPSAWLTIFLEGLALIMFKNRYPRFLVLEVGLDRPGDIKRIARWLHPHIVVVTRIGETPVHVEFFESREALVKEKEALVRSLSEHGIAVLNAYDPDVMRMKEATKGTIVTFGPPGSAFSADNIGELFDKQGVPTGVSAQVSHSGSVMPLRLHGTLGRHYIENALAGLCVALRFDINPLHATERLASFSFPHGRLTILKGKNKSVVLDDTYNASPLAVKNALQALANATGGRAARKIAVLGDMLELGKYSSAEHKAMGAFAAHAADVLFTVGMRAKIAGASALDEGMKPEAVRHFGDSSMAADFLEQLTHEGDIILVKGSQGVRMEKIVAKILAEGEVAAKLLVRQEKEWKNR